MQQPIDTISSIAGILMYKILKPKVDFDMELWGRGRV